MYVFVFPISLTQVGMKSKLCVNHFETDNGVLVYVVFVVCISLEIKHGVFGEELWNLFGWSGNSDCCAPCYVCFLKVKNTCVWIKLFRYRYVELGVSEVYRRYTCECICIS